MDYVLAPKLVGNGTTLEPSRFGKFQKINF